MYGFYGRILKIDLSKERFDITTIDEKICYRYLGGKGLAYYLLYTLNPEGVDPLSTANCMIFATGLKESKESLQKRAAEITDLIRCFNIREGLRPKDDNLPERLYKKFHKTNSGITKDEFKVMLKDYYNLRGWNQNGLPKVK